MKVHIYHCPDAPEDIRFMAIAQRETHLFHVQPGTSASDAETRLTTSLAKIEARLEKTRPVRRRHTTDADMDTALSEDAAKLTSFGADPGPTLHDLDDLFA